MSCVSPTTVTERLISGSVMATLQRYLPAMEVVSTATLCERESPVLLMSVLVDWSPEWTSCSMGCGTRCGTTDAEHCSSTWPPIPGWESLVVMVTSGSGKSVERERRERDSVVCYIIDIIAPLRSYNIYGYMLYMYVC